MLKSITKQVLESALEEEMTEHLGHEKHGTPAAGASNIRNGTRPKTVLTDPADEVQIEVPRDRAGTFSPVIVKKRQRRLLLNAAPMSMLTASICAARSGPRSSKKASRVAVSLPGVPQTIFLLVWSATRVR